ncbi:MAG: APC family permease [Synergistaceae bacterium]|nr:APC family permease [Synergistaceae bacterium]
MDANEKKQLLTRALGLPECVTITAGAVIGVGLFTVGSSQVGVMGSSVIIATILAFLLVLWPSAIYGELGATLPLAGGTYAFAKRAINYPTAVFCSWNYTFAQIGIGAAEALSFAKYFVWLMSAMHINCTVDPRIIAALLFVFFVIINYRGIEVTGKWQNAFMYFFWGASLLWFGMMLRRVELGNFMPILSGVPTGVTAFAKCILMVWWCFAGFETVVGMGAEVKFPQITIPRALIISPFIVFAINALFQWFLIGITPLAAMPGLALVEAPFADAMKAAGIIGFPFIVLCLGITFGGDFSTMNPCVTGPARYMYVMANDGNIPKIFGKVHPKYKSPYISIITVGVVGLALISRGSIGIIADICAFCQITCYIIGYISYLMLKKKEPDLERPYKVPFGTFGAYFSIIAYLGLMILSVNMIALPWNIAFDVVCLIYFALYVSRRPIPQDAIDLDLLTLQTIHPTTEEKAALDREYKIWKYGALGAFVIANLLFIVGYMMK